MATKYTYNEQRKEWYTLVYDGTYNKDGSKHRKRITSKKSSGDLEKKVSAFRRSVEESTPPTNITFGDYAKEWLLTYKTSKELNIQLESST